VASREQKFLTEEWPRYKSEFTGSFQSIAEKYKLPINGDLIQQRLEEVKFSMMDAFQAVRLKENGSHDVRNDVLRLVESILDDQGFAKHIIFHELIHATSGRMISVENSVFEEVLEDGGDSVEIELESFNHQRSGLHFFDEKDGSFNEVENPQFYWLNEAVTESLALEMIEKDENEGFLYQPNRMLLQAILEKGNIPVDRQNFYQAYFDNYDSKKGVIPKFEELIEIIERSYNKGFLFRLDDFIKKNDIQQAILAINEDWTKI
jgi:hypothetical protein